METSALTGDNVEEVFLMCARSILTRIENGLSSLLFPKHCFMFASVCLFHFLIDYMSSKTGTLDPTKVGSGVQMGEVKATSGITLDDSQTSTTEEGGCKC